MIVPFLYDFNPDQQSEQLWAFLAFLTETKKHNGAIIAPEKFFVNFKNWIDQKRVEMSNIEWAEYNCYDIPKESDLELVQQIPFPEEIYQKINSEHNSISDASASIFRESNKYLVDWLVKIISELKTTTTVEAVICLGEMPSLNEACNICNVKALFYEWGPLRPKTYLRTAYLCADGIITNNSIKSIYKEFTENCNVPIFSRKALLALMLQDLYCPCIQFLNAEPQFAVGVVAQEVLNYRNLAQGLMNNNDLIAEAKKVFKPQDILYRSRQNKQVAFDISKINIDKSLTTIQFLKLCKKILTSSSNMSFEAMLWNTNSVIIGNMPYKFMANKSLTEETKEIDDNFLNFVLFVFLIPYQRLLNYEYLQWRLKEPTVNEIFLDNLKFYCEQQNLNLDMILAAEDKEKEILRQRNRNSNGEIISDKSFPFCLDGDFVVVSIKGDDYLYKRLICVKNMQFSFSLEILQSKKISILFELPAGAKIIVNKSTINDKLVKLDAVNSESDKISFCKENPTFESNNIIQGLLHLTGSIEKIGIEKLAVERMLFAEAENWNLSHLAYDADRKVVAHKKFIDVKEKEIIEFKEFAKKQENDIQQLKCYITDLENRMNSTIKYMHSNKLKSIYKILTDKPLI